MRSSRSPRTSAGCGLEGAVARKRSTSPCSCVSDNQLASGLFFVGFGVIALWLGADMAIGTAGDMGVGYVPRMLALGCIGVRPMAARVGLIQSGVISRASISARWLCGRQHCRVRPSLALRWPADHRLPACACRRRVGRDVRPRTTGAYRNNPRRRFSAPLWRSPATADPAASGDVAAMIDFSPISGSAFPSRCL